jgi:hypothetical protein
MTKYSKYLPKRKPRKTTNPMWRGIGCLLMILVPAISYWIALALLQLTKSHDLVPPMLLGHFHFPEWGSKIPGLASIFFYLSSLEDFWAKLIFFFVILLILSGLISLLYSAVYQLIGPSRYSELDAPPENRKTREYKR